MNKTELRKMIYNSYRDLTPEYKQYADDGIRANIMSLPEYNDAYTVFCFVGKKDEIDTSVLIDKMLAEGKRVCVPLCTGKGIMEAKQITDKAQLKGERSVSSSPLPKLRQFRLKRSTSRSSHASHATGSARDSVTAADSTTGSSKISILKR